MGLPKKSHIAEHWKLWLDEHGMDWGEPSCWACGRTWWGKYDKSVLKGKSVSSGWDKVPLQRCHIVPKSLGGVDTADNLFLMCKECHDLAPNTIYKDVFLKWVSNQCWSVRQMKEINQAFESYDFSEEDSEWISVTLADKKFNEWKDKKIGLHWNQQGYGIKLTESTISGLLYEYKKIEGQK